MSAGIIVLYAVVGVLALIGLAATIVIGGLIVLAALSLGYTPSDSICNIRSQSLRKDSNRLRVGIHGGADR